MSHIPRRLRRDDTVAWRRPGYRHRLPAEWGFDTPPAPAWTLEHSNEILSRVHDEQLCTGRPCAIHRMSDHAMRSFPQHWRGDRGIIERTCPHGIGHPDPDLPFPADSHEWLHSCDGCGHDGAAPSPAC